jgi:hypothetical protein
VNLGGNTRVSLVSTPSPRVKHKGHPKVGMDLAIAQLVPTQEASNIGTLFAIAQLVPTREAARVGMDIANAKPVPTSGAVTWEYSR